MLNYFIEFFLYEKMREKGYVCDDFYCYKKDKFVYVFENFIYFVEIKL